MAAVDGFGVSYLFAGIEVACLIEIDRIMGIRLKAVIVNLSLGYDAAHVAASLKRIVRFRRMNSLSQEIHRALELIKL